MTIPLGRMIKINIITMPNTISWLPSGNFTTNLDMAKPFSQTRNSSLMTLITTTPMTAPERLPIPPTTNIVKVKKVRSR